MGRDSRGRCAGVGRVRLTRASLEKAVCVVGYNPKANEACHAAVREADVAPDVASALAHADARIVHNDGPQWRDRTSADFSGIHRTVVVDGRRTQRREPVKGIELVVLGG